MRDQMAYVLITPYSLLKSRTGGILGRLLSIPGVELVGCRMLFPSEAFVSAWLESVESSSLDERQTRLISDYCRDYLGPNKKFGISNRTILLLLRGPNVADTLRRQIGAVGAKVQGDTLHGTFGDYLQQDDGKTIYFEPGVLHAPDDETLVRQLKILAEYAEDDGGIYEGAVGGLEPDEGEMTLVLIKPDSFHRASSRPGQILDMFSRSGCFMVAMDLVRLSIAQVEDFYAPLRERLAERAAPRVESVLRAALPEKLGFRPSQDSISKAADLLKKDAARHEFTEIIKFMTSLDPALVTDPQERRKPGATRCLALLYQGHGAVDKVRAILGTHDPRRAAVGTVRSEFGSDIMRNGAHASASVEDAERERRILQIQPDAPSLVAPLIRSQLIRQTPRPR
jgi:nucleoside diphosphate kinase